MRNFHLDQMRVISCIMVIAIHVCNIYNRAFPDLSQIDYSIAAFINSFSRISVPIFFMVSGALMAGREPNIKKSLDRFLKYFIITIFWCVFYFIWGITYLDKTFDYHDILTTPTSKHLWFLYALLSIYLALPLIQTLIRNLSDKIFYYMLILFGVSVFGGYILDFIGVSVQYPIAIISQNQYLFFFVLGYVLYNKKDKITEKTKYIGLVFVVCGVAVTVCTCVVSFIQNVHKDVFFQYRNPMLVLASISAFIIMLRFPKNIPQAWEKFVRHVSDNSFGIYVFHAVFLNIIDKEFIMYKVPAWIGILIFIAIIFILSDIFVNIFRKIKYINYFF